MCTLHFPLSQKTMYGLQWSKYRKSFLKQFQFSRSNWKRQLGDVFNFGENSSFRMVKLDFEKKKRFFLHLGHCIMYNTNILYKICDEFMSLCVNFNGFVQRSVDISDVLWNVEVFERKLLTSQSKDSRLWLLICNGPILIWLDSRLQKFGPMFTYVHVLLWLKTMQ